MSRLAPALLLLLLGSSACWRGDASVDVPRQSFVARLNAVTALQHRIDALAPRIEYARQQLVGLASEAERDAIELDVARLDREAGALARYAHALRERGVRSRALDIALCDLGRIARELEQLREDVVYAKTREEREALEALSRDSTRERHRGIERRVIVLPAASR